MTSVTSTQVAPQVVAPQVVAPQVVGGPVVKLNIVENGTPVKGITPVIEPVIRTASQCAWVLMRGENKGKRCPTQTVGFGPSGMYCSKHKNGQSGPSAKEKQDVSPEGSPPRQASPKQKESTGDDLIDEFNELGGEGEAPKNLEVEYKTKALNAETKALNAVMSNVKAKEKLIAAGVDPEAINEDLDMDEIREDLEAAERAEAAKEEASKAEETAFAARAELARKVVNAGAYVAECIVPMSTSGNYKLHRFHEKWEKNKDIQSVILTSLHTEYRDVVEKITPTAALLAMGSQLAMQCLVRVGGEKETLLMELDKKEKEIERSEERGNKNFNPPYED
jgi:hypothetical protein